MHGFEHVPKFFPKMLLFKGYLRVLGGGGGIPAPPFGPVLDLHMSHPSISVPFDEIYVALCNLYNATVMYFGVFSDMSSWS